MKFDPTAWDKMIKLVKTTSAYKKLSADVKPGVDEMLKVKCETPPHRRTCNLSLKM